MAVDRDGHQGWSRKAEEGWVRVFGGVSSLEGRLRERHERERPLYERLADGPRTVAFPDQAARLIAEGFRSDEPPGRP